jgi:hypothetical protein
MSAALERHTGDPMISTNPKRRTPASKVMRAARKVIKLAMSEEAWMEG